MSTILGSMVLAAAASLPAADDLSGTTLDKVTLGDHVYGPKLNMEDLKGRVVLIEFWGIK